MCGIVALWAADSASHLSEAVDILAHRGPDDRGQHVVRGGGPALGHTRLAIIDPSDAGAQPMVSDDGEIVLVFNGEIYNHREMREELKADGVRFRGHSDTEVLLRLYKAEGIACLDRLNGMFAFALFDARRRELLVVRDPLGVKPLYFADTASGFACASELKVLSHVLGSEANLDLLALHRYLTFLWCPGDRTPLQEVRKLGPGEYLRVRDRRVVDRREWYGLPQTRGSRPLESDKQDIIQRVRHSLRTAVHRQLVSDVPVGAFLSGGLDSSAVVAFARELVPDLQCFTIRTEGGRDAGEADDLPYARQVASHLGVPLDVVSVGARQIADDVERLVWRLDEPLADPAALNVLYLSEAARGRGIKVVLSGSGGDDLFSGYRRHLAVRHEPLWSWLPRGARRGLATLSRRLDQRTALGRRLHRLFAGAAESGDERLISYFAWMQASHLTSLYSADMRAAAVPGSAAEPMLEFLKGVDETIDPLERMLALEQRFFLTDHNLTYTDKMSMTAGVEVRVPFLALDLVGLAARVPPKWKQKGRTGKWILRRAVEPYLPRAVVRRPKTGFGAPLRRWMRHDLRELLGDLLSEESLRRRGLFDPRAVQTLIEDNHAGRRDASYTLFSLLCIEIWCRRFLDGGGRAAEGLL